MNFLFLHYWSAPVSAHKQNPSSPNSTNPKAPFYVNERYHGEKKINLCFFFFNFLLGILNELFPLLILRAVTFHSLLTDSISPKTYTLTFHIFFVSAINLLSFIKLELSC